MKPTTYIAHRATGLQPLSQKTNRDCRMRQPFLTALLALLALCALGAGAPAAAQTAQTAPQSAPQTTPSSIAQPLQSAHAAPAADADSDAALTVFNRAVFVFRAPLAGYSSTDRAKRAKTRIHERLDLDGARRVALVPDALGLLLQLDGATLFVITPGDVDSTQDETLDALGAKTQQAMETVITESRESRDLRAMVQSGAWAVGATAVALLGVFVGRRLRRRLALALHHWAAARSGQVHLAGIPLLHPQRAERLARLALGGLYQLLLGVLAFQWLSLVLSRFPYTRPWGDALSLYLFTLAATVGNAVVGAVPGLATALVIFWLARAFNRALAGFYDRVIDGQIQLDWMEPDVVLPTRRVTTVLVWLFALAMAYPYLPGANTEAFKGLSVLAGLMLSLGASSLVGQAASGLILTYGRVFRTGEYVRLADQEGTVTEIGMFATRIRTGLGEELSISNAQILGSTTKNYSRAVKGAGYVLDATVTIGYDVSWRQVHAMLCEAAHRTEGVLADPAPVVFQTALTDWYPEYRLVCQATASEPRPRALVLSQLHAHIQDVFNEQGVQIMSPQYIADPQEPKIVPPERWQPSVVTRTPAR